MKCASLTSVIATNPYGTPTSLSLVSSQEPIPPHRIDVSSIPDSPTSRRVTSVDEILDSTIDHERERTKDESPEIELSVHDVRPSEPRHMTKQTNTEAPPPGLLRTLHSPVSSTHLRATVPKEDSESETRESNIQQSPQDVASNALSPLTPQKMSPKSARGEVHDISNHPRRSSDDIFDTELDIEDVPERQRVHGTEHLELNFPATDRCLSPHAPSRISNGIEDGYSSILQIPKSGQGTVGCSSSELTVPDRLINGIGSTIVNNLEERQKTASPYGFNQSRTMSSQSDRSKTKGLQDEEGIAHDKLLPEEEPQCQAATISSQEYNLPTKNWSHLDAEHPFKQALSRGRRPKFSKNPSLTDEEVSGSDRSEHQTEEEARRRKEAEEQKEKEKARERRAEQRRTVKEMKAKDNAEEEDRRRINKKRIPDCMTDETRLAKDEKAGEDKARVEKLADAERKTLAVTQEKGEEVVEANAAQVAKAKEKRVSEKTRNDGDQMREQFLKEKALAEEAEKTRLRQDGANQLVVEELQKQNRPVSFLSASKGAAAKTPRSANYKPRTVEQKAKRTEQAAKKRAQEQGRVLEARGPPNWAEALFQSNGLMDHSSERIDTDTEEEKPLRKVKAKSLGRDCQKLRDSSAHQPAFPSEPNGQPRKSLTPALPSSTVIKSPSIRGSLKFSSPLPAVLSAQMETPLRSALKHHQAPSAQRRSVSFVHDQGEDSAHNYAVPPTFVTPKPYSSTTLPAKTLVDLNNELALPPPTVTKDSRKAPVNMSTDNEILKESVAKKDIVQQKLNVIRDKRLKGRAVDTPISSEPGLEAENVLFSSQVDLDSAPASDDDVGNDGQAKAGPSSRKRPRTGSRQEPVARFNLRGTPIDPAIQNMQSTTSELLPYPLSTRASPTSNSSSQRKSVSRSPAQVMSETMSVSSTSSSGSQPESEAESGTDSESASDKGGEVLKVRTPSSTRFSQPSAIESDVAKKIIKVRMEPPKRESSRQAEDSSIRNEAKIADDMAAGEQLLSGSSQPVVPAQTTKTAPMSGEGIASHHILLNQGLNRDGRLPNGTRPAYYTYPKLSTLRELQMSTTAEVGGSALSAQQSFAGSPPGAGESSTSSSNETSNESSDESSVSDSDEDNVTTGLAGPSSSPTGSKSRSGGLPGMKSVIKRKIAQTQQVVVC